MAIGSIDKADRYRRLALEIARTDAERAKKDEEHASLLELVVAGDVEGAAAVMREHIDTILSAQAARRPTRPD
ncbi:FCD domain-containing protein [Actinoalloteichus hymeniacidonis]|uniref:FCD domain-containing protein n=1 Tax=Actinoalloteichus hymeniacidonis TaxID=340345 RepID=A0AAC9HS30_9PSEU|nr:FCD domain-containing protein [Actinoalloteichus hymeniacidonis]AOS64136.1 FCD domain-containing protein [Actinoalloteichus hymeniacidonis]MBB5907798.1 DNA-binding GntR family transcriptional regulator [Actinoalloteichus hymeniacidonis]